MTHTPEDVERERQAKDEAYRERNQVVAALARLFPSGIARTDIPGWDPEWHGCVYIDTPAGQLSWHYHDREAELFAGLPAYTKPWDGHTTEEKYRRLAALSVMSEWRTIDSAPKDGTRILGAIKRINDLKEDRCVAFWDDKFECWVSVPGKWSMALTHWQSLPTPPEQP